MRDHTKDPLLRRTGRRLELTPGGEALRRPVSELLSQIDAILTRPHASRAAQPRQR